MAIPLIWMVLTSVSTLEETRHFPPSLPSGLHWQNYTQAWNDSPMARWLINSAIVSFTCVVSNLVLCSLAATPSPGCGSRARRWPSSLSSPP